MNEQECAGLLATDLSDIPGLTFHASGASEMAEKPYGVVRFEGFTEHPVLLGNFEGTISIHLRTLPEETSQADVDAWATEIVGRIAGTDGMDIALSGKYSAAQCWNAASSSSTITEGIRETVMEGSISIVQLS